MFHRVCYLESQYSGGKCNVNPHFPRESEIERKREECPTAVRGGGREWDELLKRGRSISFAGL